MERKVLMMTNFLLKIGEKTRQEIKQKNETEISK